MTSRLGLAAAAAVAIAIVLTGCGSGATNKAGGSQTPIVLSLADSDNSDQPSTDAIEHFAADVRRISGGSIRVHITFEAAGSDTPMVEEQTIRMVRDGRFDLGAVGARAWDEVGITSFGALQAPFLVTTTALLNRVLESPIAAEMLDSLEAQHMVGLALVPDHLRRPVGLGRKFVSLADFRHGRVRMIPSKTTAALLRALGATPLAVDNDQIGLEIENGHVNGEEMSLYNSPGNSVVTANIVFFGKALTLFANAHAYRRLSGTQRKELLAAAADTTRYSATHNPSERVFDPNSCVDGRRIVLARPADVRAVVRAARPVYAQLEADPQTKRFIAEIRAMKAALAPPPPLRIAAACSRIVAPATAAGRRLSPSLLNGTYRWVLTAADARAFGPPATGAGNAYPTVGTAVLKNGTWRFIGPSPAGGTYSIRSDRVRFVWPSVASVLVFRFAQDVDGTLHLRAVPPMDAGDRFVWSYEPWRRIGPPGTVAH